MPPMKTTTNKGLYTVVANGTRSVPMSKASANRVAKALRDGKGGYKPVAATVVPA